MRNRFMRSLSSSWKTSSSSWMTSSHTYAGKWVVWWGCLHEVIYVPRLIHLREDAFICAMTHLYVCCACRVDMCAMNHCDDLILLLIDDVLILMDDVILHICVTWMSCLMRSSSWGYQYS
jgi:hypothetical protein